MTYLFANNARSTLAAGINDSVTALSVQAGDGLLFPSPTGVEEFRCVIYNAAGDYEIIAVTTRATDAFSVIVRGQEGTSPAAWSADDYISLRTTKESLEYFLQHSDVDDTPANGATTVPVSSNRMFDHEAGTAGIHPSGDITYDNGVSGLTATDVKAAIDEVSTKGMVYQLLTPSDFELDATNPPTLVGVQASSARWASLSFDGVTNSENASSIARIPEHWGGVTFTAYVFWSHPVTTTNYGVRWEVGARQGCADGDTLDGTSADAGITDTGGTTDVMYVASGAMSQTGLTAGDLIDMHIRRNVVYGTDTMQVDARIHAVMIEFDVAAGAEV